MCSALLIGAAFAAQGELLCIEHDGNTEIESLGLLCCRDSDHCCEGENSSSQKDHHPGDCSRCADVELDSVLRSNLTPRVKEGSVPDVSSTTLIDFDDRPSQFLDNSSPLTTHRQSARPRAPSTDIVITAMLC